MNKLPTTKPDELLYMIDRARQRYEACIRVHGSRNSQTRQAKRKLGTFVANAKARGLI